MQQLTNAEVTSWGAIVFSLLPAERSLIFFPEIVGVKVFSKFQYPAEVLLSFITLKYGWQRWKGKGLGRGGVKVIFVKKCFVQIILRLYTEFQCPTMPQTGPKVCGV